MLKSCCVSTAQKIVALMAGSDSIPDGGLGQRPRTPAVHPRMPGRVRQTAGDGVLTEKDGRLSVKSRAACWGRRDTTAPLFDLRRRECNERAMRSARALETAQDLCVSIGSMAREESWGPPSARSPRAGETATRQPRRGRTGVKPASLTRNAAKSQ